MGPGVISLSISCFSILDRWKRAWLGVGNNIDPKTCTCSIMITGCLENSSDCDRERVFDCFICY